MKKILLALALLISSTTVFADQPTVCDLQRSFAGNIVAYKMKGAPIEYVKMSFSQWYDEVMNSEQVPQENKNVLKQWVEGNDLDKWFDHVYNDYTNADEAASTEEAACKAKTGS